MPRSSVKCPSCGITFEALKIGPEGHIDAKENADKIDGALSSLDEMEAYICGSCGTILEGPDAQCPECNPTPLATPPQPSIQGPQQVPGGDVPPEPATTEIPRHVKARRVLKEPSASTVQLLKKDIDEAEKSLDSLSAVAGECKGGILAGASPRRSQVDGGFSNGLGRTNGQGRTNGKTNGRTNGKTNGRINGRINGRTNGRTNGQDYVNGTGVPGRPSRGDMRAVPFGKILGSPAGMRLAALIVIIVIVISAFVALSFQPASSPYTIDGDFGDWADADTMTLSSQSGPQAADVVEWGFEIGDSSVYLYARTDGPAFDSSVVSSLFLFLDTDSSNETGYSVSGIGADYLMELNGWNGTIGSTHLYSYGSVSDMYDWNSWERIGSVDSAVSGSEMEAVAQLGVLGVSAKALLIAQDNTDGCAKSVPVPASGGVLIAEQIVPEDLAASGILPVTDSTVILRLRFSCQGAPGSVQQVTPIVSGAQYSSSISPFELNPGQTHMVDIAVDSTMQSAGDLASAWLPVSGVQSSFSSVLVLGDGSRAYVESAPSTVKIDGAFADWENRTCPDSDAVPMTNEDIDITAIGNADDTENSYFYISVLGEIVCGKAVPAFRYIPVPGGGGIPTEPPRKTGEDYFRVYIDSDMNNSTGESVSASGKRIGAEKMIEVSGIYGRITDSRVLEFQNSAWVEVDDAVTVEKDARRMEIGVAQLDTGNGTGYDYMVESSDWQDRSDLATLQQGGTRASVSSLGGGFDIERWIVDSATSSAFATSMSYQRKLFHDGTNFWSIYFDGTNSICRYSSDGGLTWTNRGSIFTTSGVNEVSVWYDGPNNVVYAIGDTGTASANIYLQRGVVSPASHTITWSASDSTLGVTTNSLAGKNGFISKDTNGYVWLLATNCTQASPARYDFSAFRSTSTDSISSWTYSAGMQCASPQSNIYGSIVPAGSGSDMWTIYSYNGNIGARKYTGTWSGETSLFASTASGFEDVVPPSTVVDAQGVIHVVYGDDHESPKGTFKPFIRYTYNSGGSWSSALRLDTANNNNGNRYPTISLDSSTKDLYVFWIQIDSMAIVAKKNVSGTWSFVDIGTQTSYTKQYLTSVYSVSGATNICWLWTQNTSAPIQVYFDKIPEFGNLAYPSIGMIALIIFVANRARRRKAQ